MLAQLLVFIIALIPASLGFGGVFFATRWATGWPAATVFGAGVAAVILAAESALGVMLLGHLFDRLDLSAELPT